MADGDPVQKPASTPLPMRPPRAPSRTKIPSLASPEEVFAESRRLFGRPAPAPPEVREAAVALKAEPPAPAPPTPEAPEAPKAPEPPRIEQVEPPGPAGQKDIDKQIGMLEKEARKWQALSPRELSWWDMVQQVASFLLEPLLGEPTREKVQARVDVAKEKIARLDLARDGLRPVNIAARDVLEAREYGKGIAELGPDASLVQGPEWVETQLVRRKFASLTGDDEYGVPMTYTADGKLAFDEAAMRAELVAVFQDRRLEANPGADPVRVSELTREAEAQADREIRMIKARAFSVPFVVDDARVKRGIMRLPVPSWRVVAAALTPSTKFVETGRMTSKTAYSADPLALLGRMSAPITLPVGALATMLETDEGLGTLAVQTAQYLSAFTPAGSVYALTGQWPTAWDRLGSEAGVEALMTNADMLVESGKIGQLWVDALPENLRPVERRGAAAAVFGVATAIATILIEPDPVSILGMGAGKVAKAVSRASQVRKLDRFIKANETVQKALTPQFADLEKLAETLAEAERIAGTKGATPEQKKAATEAKLALTKGVQKTARELERTLADYGVAYERFVALLWASMMGRETGATQQVVDILARVTESMEEPFVAAQKTYNDLLTTHGPALRSYSKIQKDAAHARRGVVAAQDELRAAQKAYDAPRPADKYPDLAAYNDMDPATLAKQPRDKLRQYVRWHLGVTGQIKAQKKQLLATVLQVRARGGAKAGDTDAALKAALDAAKKKLARAEKLAKDTEALRLKVKQGPTGLALKAVRRAAAELMTLRRQATKDFSKELVVRIYREVGTARAPVEAGETFRVAALKAVHRAFVEALDAADRSFVAYKTAISNGTGTRRLPEADKVLADATVSVDRKAATQTIDQARLREAVAIIPAQIRARAIVRDKAGPLLLSALGGDGQVTLTVAEAGELRTLLGRLFQEAALDLAPGGREGRVARAILKAEQEDWNIRPGRTAIKEWFPDSTIASYVDETIRASRQTLRWLFSTFSPDKSRLGLISKEVAQVYKSFELYLSQARSELGEFSDLDPARFVQYVDSNDPIPHARGSTWVNTMFGDHTLWSAAREHMLGMFRLEDGAAKGELEAFFLQDTTNIDNKGEQVATTAFEALIRAHYGGDVTGPGGAGLPLIRKAARTLLESDEFGLTFEAFDAALRRLVSRAEMPIFETIIEDGIEVQSFTGRYAPVTGLQPFGAIDARRGRSAALQTMAILRGALLWRAELQMLQAMGTRITTEEAKTVNNLLTRTTARLVPRDRGAPADLTAAERLIDEALDIIERLGTTITQSKTVVNEELREQKKALKKLVALHQNPDGTVFFLQKNVVDEINASTTRIIKELEPVSQRGLDPWTSLRGLLGKWIALLKTSMTVGWLLPKPRHTVANTGIGDVFGQVLFAEGAYQATRTFVQGLPAQFPMYGRLQRPLWARMERVTRERFGDVPVLNTITEAMTNPHLAALFTGEDGTVILGNNVYSYAQLREMILEDGILQSVVQEELVEMVNLKLRGGGVSKWLDWWQHEIIAHAEIAQQRQRVSFYLDLLRQGVPRKQAAERTMAALYDWKHGFAAWEMGTFIRFNLPWYRWARLAAGQAFSTLAQPFIEPSDTLLKAALQGQTPLARLLKVDRLRRATALWASTESEPDYMPDDHLDELERLGGLLSPSTWQQDRFFYGAPASLERKAWWKEQGRNVTHTTSVFPSLGLIETSRWLVNAMFAPVLIGMDALPGTPLHATPEAFRLLFADDALDMLGPISDYYDAAVKDGQTRPGFMWVSPQEALWVAAVQRSGKVLPWNWLETPGAATPWVDRDPETGQYLAKRSVTTLLRLVPLSLQMPSYIKSLNEAKIAMRVNPEKPFRAAASALFLDLTGIKTHYDYNVMDGQERRVKAVIDAARKVDQDNIRRYGPPPEIVR